MNDSSFDAWVKVGWDAWMLGAEASAVIGLRTARLAMGGAAGTREATLMVSEKIRAGLELQAAMVGAGLGLTPLSGTQQAVRLYRRKVAANRRRLLR